VHTDLTLQRTKQKQKVSVLDGTVQFSLYAAGSHPQVEP